MLRRIIRVLLCCCLVVMIPMTAYGIEEANFSPPPPTSSKHSCHSKKDIEKNLQNHVRVLTEDIGERSVDQAENLERAASYIESYFKNLGYVVYRQNYLVGSQQVSNVIAEKPGTTHPEQIIVIGAHYDSLAGTVGADDNASGVAGMLEAACALGEASTSTTVRFVAFVNEEPPFFKTDRMGSVVYAKSLKQANENVLGMISLESLGIYYSEPHTQELPDKIADKYPHTGNFLAFIGDTTSEEFLTLAFKAFRNVSSFPTESLVARRLDGIRGLSWSDHWSFWQQGYPAFMITDTAIYRYQHYHEETDLTQQLNYPEFAEVVYGLQGMLRSITSKQQD